MRRSKVYEVPEAAEGCFRGKKGGAELFTGQLPKWTPKPKAWQATLSPDLERHHVLAYKRYSKAMDAIRNRKPTWVKVAEAQYVQELVSFSEKAAARMQTHIDSEVAESDEEHTVIEKSLKSIKRNLGKVKRTHRGGHDRRKKLRT